MDFGVGPRGSLLPWGSQHLHSVSSLERVSLYPPSKHPPLPLRLVPSAETGLKETEQAPGVLLGGL